MLRVALADVGEVSLWVASENFHCAVPLFGRELRNCVVVLYSSDWNPSTYSSGSAPQIASASCQSIYIIQKSYHIRRF
jgi:hypothetical protein